MTIKDFVAKYDGKFVEYHSFNPLAINQCTDLANQWITEGLGLTAIIGSNAQDFPKKIGNEFTYILNTPTGQPEPGDLMIFKSADGVGHISIHYLNTSLSLFTSFDQNFPLKSPCKLTNHNYTNVLGWLRAKEVTTSDNTDLEAIKKTLTDVTRQRDELDVLNKKKDGIITEITAQLTEANTNVKGFRTERDYLLAETAKRLGTRQEPVEILTAIDTCIGFEDANSELQRRIELDTKEHMATIDGLSKEIATLKATTEASSAKILQLETTIKDLKYSPTTPIQTTTFWSIISSIFKRS